MTLYREQLVDVVVQQLLAANTLAGTSVYAARDWPITEVQLPSIMVKAPTENKESLGRAGVPKFNTTSSIAVLMRATGASSAAVETTLSQMCDQAQTALLRAGQPLQLMVQQFRSVDTEIRTSSEGNAPLGDALMIIACEFYEEFDALPADGQALSQVGITIPPPNAGATTIYAGANIADPSAPLTTNPA